jgi:hypothetical protein
MERAFGRFAHRLDDMGDQIRANTQAVLLAIDRLEGNGST